MADARFGRDPATHAARLREAEALLHDHDAFNPHPASQPYTLRSWVVGVGFVVGFAACFIFGVI